MGASKNGLSASVISPKDLLVINPIFTGVTTLVE